jgi:ornithine cyclodeaminase
VLGEIGEVFAGLKPGRTGPDEVTVYKSLGAIVQDLYSGLHVYRRAAAEGRGVPATF